MPDLHARERAVPRSVLFVESEPEGVLLAFRNGVPEASCMAEELVSFQMR